MTRFAKILLAIVVVAFGIRVFYVAVAKRGPCPIVVNGRQVGTYPSECAVGDQIFYDSEANRVAQGKGFVEPLWNVSHPGQAAPPAADHPPLTVMALTPVAWMLDHRPLSAFSDAFDTHVREDRYVMVVLGTIVVLLVGLLGRRVGGDAVGLVAAGVAAVSPNFWVNDGLVMSETITTLTVVGALLLVWSLRAKPSYARAIALGVVCGLAALARAELVLFGPMIAVGVALAVGKDARRRLTLAGTVLVVTGLVIAPWVGFNLSRFKDSTFISTNDGIALAGSNCDPVYSGTAIGLTSITGPKSCLDTPPPPGDQSQVAQLYRRRSFHYMRTHLRRVPLVMAARVGRTWSLYRPLDMVRFNEGEGREPWVTRLGLLAFYPTLVAAAGGVVVLWRRRARADLWFLLVPCIAVTVGSATTYGQTRFRAAAEPSLAIFAAVGVVTAWSWWSARRAARAPSAATAPIASGA